MAWPPKIGEPLPLAVEAIGVREKLIAYVLNPSHKDGGPKARGFESILGITADHASYLESQIRTGILTSPVSRTRSAFPGGFSCVVELPILGLGAKRGRTINVRTVWLVTGIGKRPRLTTAFPKP
jgi:filamentous hemagglutinin